MCEWPLETSTTADVPGSMAQLAVQVVGVAEFAHTLLIGVRSELLAASYCSLFSIRPGIGAQVLDVAGLETPGAGAEPARRYVEDKFYGHDPLVTGVGEVRSHFRLCHSADIAVADYRIGCYERLGVHQRCSLVFPWQEKTWLSLNFYRALDDCTFSARELDSLHACGPLLISSVHRHLRIVQTSESPMTRLRRLFAASSLTPREIQVVAGVLEGLSSKEIARRLGVEAATVATYRERGYRKLGISRHADLVRLLLADLPPQLGNQSAALAGSQVF